MARNALWIVVIIAWLSCAFSVGLVCGYARCREDAIRAGVGRWESDPRTGEQRFVWMAGGRP